MTIALVASPCRTVTAVGADGLGRSVAVTVLAAAGVVGGAVAIHAAVSALKAAQPALQLVTPGIRPAGSALDDQRRILTPREALDAGSDYLVIGRPIARAADPARAVEEILATLK